MRNNNQCKPINIKYRHTATKTTKQAANTTI